MVPKALPLSDEAPELQIVLLIATAAGLFLGGLCAAVIGSIKLPMARRLRMDEGRVGILVASFSITFLPVVILSGWMIDAFGAGLVLLVSLLGAAIGLVLMALAGQFMQAICAAIFLSVAWSTLINVVHVMIPLAFPGSIVTGTNVADVFFSLGALTTPLLAAQMVRGETYRGLLFLIAAVAAGAGAFCLLLPAAPLVPKVEGAGEGISFLQQPRIWLCGIALCLFGPIETTFATWTSSYLVEKGFPDRFGTRMISGFWGASMISRLVVAFLLPLLWFSMQETWIVLVLAVVATLVTLLIVITPSRRAAPWLVVAAGLACGPLFPTVLAILFLGFDPSIHGRALGTTLAIGNLGYTLTPLVVGLVARKTSVQRSFIVLTLSGIGLIGVSVALMLHVSLAEPLLAGH